MKKRMLPVLFFIVLPILFMYRLSFYELDHHEEIEISFQSNHLWLRGSIYLPKGDPPYDLAFILHGDGPVDRTGNGDYVFIINHLLEEGIACFSYDKAGIGDSEGDWLKQTMADRSQETQSALEVLENTGYFDQIGLLAFSQGGWVVAEMAKENTSLDYLIVVGGAIDWLDQHLYYEEMYARKQGYQEEEVQAYLTYVASYDQLIRDGKYQDYIHFVRDHHYEEPMTEEDFHFAYLNADANARAGIHEIKVPFLGIWGQDDQKVKAKESYDTYQEIFTQNEKTDYKLMIFTNANHSLLKSRYDNKPFLLLLDSFLQDENIFVTGYLDAISNWIKKPSWD